jgi:hypothetical protein
MLAMMSSGRMGSLDVGNKRKRMDAQEDRYANPTEKKMPFHFLKSPHIISLIHPRSLGLILVLIIPPFTPHAVTVEAAQNQKSQTENRK